MELQSALISQELSCEEIGQYVAELQLHMTLQARNLVPTLKQTSDHREQFLQESQAYLEKLASRQRIEKIAR